MTNDEGNLEDGIENFDENETNLRAIEEYENQAQFIELLKSNKLKTPNDFTIEMGDRIRKVREGQGISQAKLAKKLKRRQATVSDIENGKSDIGILTLLQFAVVLNKPISYFFSETLLKEWLVEIQTPFQHNLLDLVKQIENFQGDEVLVYDLLNALSTHYQVKFYDSIEDQEP